MNQAPNWPAPRKGNGTTAEKSLFIPSRKPTEKPKEKPTKASAKIVIFPTSHPFWIGDGMTDDHSGRTASTA